MQGFLAETGARFESPFSDDVRTLKFDPNGRRRPIGWAIGRLFNVGVALLGMAALLQTQPLKGERSTKVEATLGGGSGELFDDGETPSADEFEFEEPPAPPLSAKPPKPSSVTVRDKDATDHRPSMDAMKVPLETNVPARPAIPPPAPSPANREEDSKRIRVRTELGKTVVAKVVGANEGQLHILLPDGQMGIADSPAYTDQPFVISPVNQIIEDLKSGPFAAFKIKRFPHYLIVYQGTEEFAETSGKVLEDLYKGLLEAFRKRKIPVHEAEFPLLAVIFRSEEDFRDYKAVANEIQAYYEIYSNRIFFYETSKRDEEAPEVAALRRPQTVAHEGTHQILQNIGIQPRLADWPPWLIEGLAEYCSTPLASKKKGTTWNGIGVINSLHLATIKDLNDPRAVQFGAARPEHIGRPKGMPLVEYLIKKTDLNPTDYALAWAMTHYLAMKKVDPFLGYLKAMSQLKPLEPMTPESHLATFRAAFGNDLAKLDREIDNYLGKMKVNTLLPYYAVVFQQRIGNTTLYKRAAIVSQSPTMIRQWLETVTNPNSEPPSSEVYPFPSRSRALEAAEEWVQSNP